MFTPRSARAKKHLPRAPGLSSIVTVNSFAFAMRLDSLPFQDTDNPCRSLSAETGCRCPGKEGRPTTRVGLYQPSPRNRSEFPFENDEDTIPHFGLCQGSCFSMQDESRRT